MSSEHLRHRKSKTRRRRSKCSHSAAADRLIISRPRCAEASNVPRDIQTILEQLMKRFTCAFLASLLFLFAAKCSMFLRRIFLVHFSLAERPPLAAANALKRSNANIKRIVSFLVVYCHISVSGRDEWATRRRASESEGGFMAVLLSQSA